ncbi:MAG TPA: TnsA endonuclease N-terminal domain-containing protein [Azospirillaceae bacterium]|nr:TnsA endonuclease N-terminal domain-containing protein [Azospirillaceae bacterium]
MPVRTIPRNHRSLTGQIASRSQGRPIAFESALERDFALLQIFDPTVESVEEQPVRIEYRAPTGRPSQYTPDFLVSYRTGGSPHRLVEVKYQAELDRKAERYAACFEAARAFAAERGWAFEVVTEVAIRTPRLENVRFLLPFQNRRFSATLRSRLVEVIATAGTMTVADVLENAKFSNESERMEALACLWNLLSRGCVHADIGQPLSMSTVLHFAGEDAHGR